MKTVSLLRLTGAYFILALSSHHAATAQDAPLLNDCALARDPVRCLARTDAIAACADLHGEKKRDCLLVRLPPPDCKAAPDPHRCQREQDARDACTGLESQSLRSCLRDQGIAAPQTKKVSKKKTSKKSRPSPKPLSKQN